MYYITRIQITIKKKLNEELETTPTTSTEFVLLYHREGTGITKSDFCKHGLFVYITPSLSFLQQQFVSLIYIDSFQSICQLITTT